MFCYNVETLFILPLICTHWPKVKLASLYVVSLQVSEPVDSLRMCCAWWVVAFSLNGNRWLGLVSWVPAWLSAVVALHREGGRTLTGVI